jgi:hypothetical protein
VPLHQGSEGSLFVIVNEAVQELAIALVGRARRNPA